MNRKTLVYIVLIIVLFSFTILTGFARTPSSGNFNSAQHFEFENHELANLTSRPQQIEFASLEQSRLTSPAEFKFDVGNLPAVEQFSLENGGETCSQILVNTRLDVVEIGGGLGTAEPWVVIENIVYYTDQVYISPNYSLFLADGDGDDPTPGVDVFGQAFIMPDNLTSVTFDYWTLQIDQDPIPYDRIFGEIWSVDNDGFLVEALAGWEFNEYSDELWHQDSAFVPDPALLATLENRRLAVLFLNITDELPPHELAVFDDITMTVCFTTPTGGPRKVFLPAMINRFSTGPSCFPPTENPPDEFDANRGLVQTGATCNTTLSNLDQQDYYTYRTNQSGTYRFALSALPPGSEWSVTVFVDAAPYPIAAGGSCRTTQPGSSNKFVDCNLPANGNFFIKVSAGNWQGGTAGYTLQVTRR